jgi:predicted O-methyltransferase YrrM
LANVCHSKLENYITPIPLPSTLAADVLSFHNVKFDMIYIDGDHAYEGCLRDLLLSHQKIKSGGWIMGHDYDMNMEKAQTRYEFGVKQAVDEYCRDYNQSIYAKAMDGCVGYAIQVKK